MNRSAFFYIVDGMELIFKPGIRLFVIIPFLINVLFFCLLLFVAGHYFSSLQEWLLGFFPHWLAWAVTLLWIVFFAAFFILLAFSFTFVANIIAAPFNGFLAERVEMYLTGKQLPSRTLWENVKDIPRIIGRQFGILLGYLMIALPLFIGLFIPVIHWAVLILWVLFNAWCMSLQYLDFAADAHRVSLGELKERMHHKRWVTFSLGFGILVVTLIPFLNFIAVPAAVAGATKAWVEEYSF